jgi:micrococcal nuclease
MQWLLLVVLFILAAALLLMSLVVWQLLESPPPPLPPVTVNPPIEERPQSPAQLPPLEPIPPGVTPESLPQFDFRVTWADVDAVLDGDTIRLSDGRRVRYIGIDTPEIESNPPECFAREATTKNRALVEGKRVALRKDKSETDRYGRLLRYVYLSDGSFVNEILVRNGYAVAATFRPDVRFADDFTHWQAEARANERGLWKKCNMR